MPITDGCTGRTKFIGPLLTLLGVQKMMSLTKEQMESCENTKICYICKEKFENKYVKDKKYCKVRDYCHYTGEYRGAPHNICNLKYSVTKKIPMAFFS